MPRSFTSLDLRPLLFLILGIGAGPAAGSASPVAKDGLVASAACEKYLFETEPVGCRWDFNLGQWIITYWSRTEHPGAEFTTTVYRSYGAPSVVPAPVVEDVLDRAFAEIEPLVRLANVKFEARRAWTPEFSLKNLAVARRHLTDSTYVLIHDPAGRLLGGIRNIQVRADQTLPEEKYLDVVLPALGHARRPGDLAPWKNEVGTLVVDENLGPDLRRKIILEIWAHLHHAFFSKPSLRENRYDQAFHTYGDRASLLLYKPLGFKKLRTYVHAGTMVDHSHLAERDVPPLVIDGEPWWPLVLVPGEAKALNVKFSTDARGADGRQWLSARRRRLAASGASAFDFGAFFDDVLTDLASPDDPTFLAALRAMDTFVTEAWAHREVARRDLRDVSTTEAAIPEIVRSRDELYGLYLALKNEIPRMSAERRRVLTVFLGRMLNLGERAMSDVYCWGFFEDVVFVLAADPELEVAEPMLKFLVDVMTPRQWIEETALALDLGRHADGPEFVADVAAAEPRILTHLAGRGYDRPTIERVVAPLGRMLFAKPRVLGDLEGEFRVDHSVADPAVVALHLLPRRDAHVVQWLVQLAAARAYLAEPGRQSLGGMRARGLSPGTSFDAEPSAARARSVTKRSWLARARAIFSTSSGR